MCDHFDEGKMVTNWSQNVIILSTLQLIPNKYWNSSLYQICKNSKIHRHRVKEAKTTLIYAFFESNYKPQ